MSRNRRYSAGWRDRGRRGRPRRGGVQRARCEQQPGRPAEARPAAATAGPIKIAVVDAQSGQLSDLGQFEWRRASSSPSTQANAAGGVDGRKIQLTLFDDQGDPTVGTELARKIASEGYVAMFGTAESAVTDRHGAHPQSPRRSPTSPRASPPS